MIFYKFSFLHALFSLMLFSSAVGGENVFVNLEPGWKIPYLLDSHSCDCRRYTDEFLERCSHEKEISIVVPAGESLWLKQFENLEGMCFYESNGSALFEKVFPKLRREDSEKYFELKGDWRSPSVFKIMGSSYKSLKNKVWVTRTRESIRPYPARNEVVVLNDPVKTTRIHHSHPSRSEVYTLLLPEEPLQFSFENPVWLQIDFFRPMHETEPDIYESGLMVLSGNTQSTMNKFFWTARPEWRRHVRWDEKATLSQSMQWTTCCSEKGLVELKCTKPLWVRVHQFDQNPYGKVRVNSKKDELWSNKIKAEERLPVLAVEGQSLEHAHQDQLNEIYFNALQAEEFNALEWIHRYQGRAFVDPSYRSWLLDLSTKYIWYRDLLSAEEATIELPHRPFQLKNPWGTDGHLEIVKEKERKITALTNQWVEVSKEIPMKNFLVPQEPKSRIVEFWVGDIKAQQEVSFRLEYLDGNLRVLGHAEMTYRPNFKKYDRAQMPSDKAFDGSSVFISSSVNKVEVPVDTKQIKVICTSMEDLCCEENLKGRFFVAARQQAQRSSFLEVKEMEYVEQWLGMSKLELFESMLNQNSKSTYTRGQGIEAFSKAVFGVQWKTILNRIEREADQFSKTDENDVQVMDEGYLKQLKESQWRELSIPEIRTMLIASMENEIKREKLDAIYLELCNYDRFHEGMMRFYCWKVKQFPTVKNIKDLVKFLYHQSFLNESYELLSVLPEKDQPMLYLENLKLYFEEEKASDLPSSSITHLFSWQDYQQAFPKDVSKRSLYPKTHWAYSKWVFVEPFKKLHISLEGPRWYRLRMRPVFTSHEIKEDVVWGLGINGNVQKGFLPSQAPSENLYSDKENCVPGRSWSRRIYIPEGSHLLEVHSESRSLLLDLDIWKHINDEEIEITQDEVKAFLGVKHESKNLHFENTYPQIQIGRDFVDSSPNQSQKVIMNDPQMYPIMFDNTSDLYFYESLGPLKAMIGLREGFQLSKPELVKIANKIASLPQGEMKKLFGFRFNKLSDWRSLETPQQSSGFVSKPIRGWNPTTESGKEFLKSLNLVPGGEYRLLETQSSFSQTLNLVMDQTLKVKLELKSTSSILRPVELLMKQSGRSRKVLLDHKKRSIELPLFLEAGLNEILFEIKNKVSGHAIMIQLRDDQGKDLLYRDKSLRFYQSNVNSSITHPFAIQKYLKIDEWTEEEIKTSYRIVGPDYPLKLESKKPRYWRVSELVSQTYIPDQLLEQHVDEIENKLMTKKGDTVELQDFYTIQESDFYPQNKWRGVWQLGGYYQSGIAEDEERDRVERKEHSFFVNYRFLNEKTDNYHKTSISRSHFEDGSPLSRYEHQISHDHRVLPLTSIVVFGVNHQEVVGEGDEQSFKTSWELSRPIRLSMRWMRRPSFQVSYVWQSLEPGHQGNKLEVSPEVYSRYRHEHAFQWRLGEKLTWIEKENSRWSLEMKVLGNHGDKFYQLDQFWTRLRWEGHARSSIWRIGIRGVHRLNDLHRSSSSFDPILNMKVWGFMPKVKIGYPIVSARLNHGLRDRESKFIIEMSYYFDRFRKMKDHREGDPPFLSFWKDKLEGDHR